MDAEETKAPKQVALNVNSMIEVTLTEAGLALFEAGEREKAEAYALIGKLYTPEPSVGSIRRVQLWEAMMLFGPESFIGGPELFVGGEIRISTEDLKTIQAEGEEG